MPFDEEDLSAMAEEGQLAAHDHSTNDPLHRLGTIILALVHEVRALRAQKAGSWLERDATTEEVRAQAEKLRTLAVAASLTNLQLRDDGLVVVHTDEAGYSAVARFAIEASRAVGAWVRAVTDDSLGGRTSPRHRAAESERPTLHITRRTVTVDELRARARAWEAAHPGYGSDNWVDAFRDEDGELIESSEFVETGALYERLAHGEEMGREGRDRHERNVSP